ncbi:hypothetical protein K474DRAFT_1587678 [Panus rudis PR-1116 ss-1]|nr:hypothetical protein K474DRAFT_1587678 [Panus rudis PR-1116 ss-1]
MSPSIILPGILASVGLLYLAVQKPLFWWLRGTPCAPHTGYILHNTTTHARFLPKESSHSFTYPILGLFVSLNALENHELDLAKGWLFGYGPGRGRITGLRSSAYLGAGTASIKDKLQEALRERGFDPASLDDAWLLTMPSYLGFEGINPLSVYFCYTAQQQLSLVVLEVHNTFGEQHIYIIRAVKGWFLREISCLLVLTCSFYRFHQWTIPRQFHVSPFNDRSGFYRIVVAEPPHAPNYTPSTKSVNPPRWSIRIDLLTQSLEDPNVPGPAKFTATLRPTSTLPLTTPALIISLLQWPFALFLSFPRICYQAWILHYRKHLSVYPRPDPHPVIRDGMSGHLKGGGTQWLPATLLERFAMRRTYDFLQERVNELHIGIQLVCGDPSKPTKYISPNNGLDNASPSDVLVVTYSAPRFFTNLLISPSAEHALLLREETEGTFKVSSEELFKKVMDGNEGSAGEASYAQRLRFSFLSESLRGVYTPALGALDRNPTSLDLDLRMIVALLAFAAFDRLEKWIYVLVGARFVPGYEPWKRWDRAIERKQRGDSRLGGNGDARDVDEHSKAAYKLGSVRREVRVDG